MVPRVPQVVLAIKSMRNVWCLATHSRVRSARARVHQAPP